MKTTTAKIEEQAAKDKRQQRKVKRKRK